VSVPLPQTSKDRLERRVAYNGLRDNLSRKWQETINIQERQEQIRFPLQDDENKKKNNRK